MLVSNTGGGTITYSWKSNGNTCVINTPSEAATTVTGGGVIGTTNLYCDVTNSVTGVTYSSPSCLITWNSAPPSAPTIGASSSGDKSFTLNWTAPVDDGGSPILGYYVQIKRGSDAFQTAVDVGNVLTYTFSGDQVIFNGYSYVGKVLAYNGPNVSDQGPYSADSAGVTPTFAAPSCSVTIQSGYPNISDPYRRPLTITINPTACIDYSYTQVYIYSNPYEDLGSFSSYVSKL